MKWSRANWAAGTATLAAIGIIGGCATQPSTETAAPETVGTVQGAISVADWATLPLCTFLNRGMVYYVVSQKSIVYCDVNGYQPLAMPQGTAGKDGTDGVSYLVATTAASLDVCPAGGIVLRLGPDANKDGVLDSVVSAVPVCNGVPGAKGDRGDQGAPGVNGTNGVNGVNGTNGANGMNALVALDTEPPGANCSAGGTKVRAGLDTNGDGILSEAETTQTSYLCTPAPPTVDGGAPDSSPPPRPSPPTSGGVIITEVMANPIVPSEAAAFAGQWFEVFNPTATTVDLSGCEVVNEQEQVFVFPSGTYIPPGYFTIADGRYTPTTANLLFNSIAFTLATFDGTLALMCSRNVIDSVSWPLAARGASLTLRASGYDSLSNDSPANWCVPDLYTYDALGNYGTPGGTDSTCQ